MALLLATSQQCPRTEPVTDTNSFTPYSGPSRSGLYYTRTHSADANSKVLFLCPSEGEDIKLPVDWARKTGNKTNQPAEVNKRNKSKAKKLPVLINYTMGSLHIQISPDAFWMLFYLVTRS